MKTLDAIKIMDIARAIIPLAMLADIAIMAIRFIRKYIGICVVNFSSYILPFLIFAYARKRTGNKVVHDYKNAVYRKNPDSGAGLSGK